MKTVGAKFVRGERWDISYEHMVTKTSLSLGINAFSNSILVSNQAFRKHLRSGQLMNSS